MCSLAVVPARLHVVASRRLFAPSLAPSSAFSSSERAFSKEGKKELNRVYRFPFKHSSFGRHPPALLPLSCRPFPCLFPPHPEEECSDSGTCSNLGLASDRLRTCPTPGAPVVTNGVEVWKGNRAENRPRYGTGGGEEGAKEKI